MKITSLKTTGFRNLKKISLTFSEKDQVTAFVGQNGQGKTNLLESIYLCALSKSFRTRTNADLIAFDQDFCRIELKVQLASDSKKLELIVTRQPSQKVLKINGVKKTALEFIGNLKVVFFSPDDLSQMAFAPRLRRRYLDILLSQLDQDYLIHLSQYEKARRQRNALLKRIREGQSQESELDFWDEKLVQCAWPILEKRKKTLATIRPKVNELYQSMSGQDPIIDLVYLSSSKELLNDESDLLQSLKKSRPRDIMLASTQVGPHRDDLQFLMDGKDMTQFASRGEWRSLVLSLKLAELELIRNKINEPPILLLDDVFSELDESRQAYLLSALNDCQTVISTTHTSYFKEVDSMSCLKRVTKGLIYNLPN